MTTTTSIPTDATLLGIGVLSWSRDERVTDRYGFVTLYATVDADKTVLSAIACRRVDRQRGRLVAQVVISRTSRHIGDIGRGIRPTRPEVGEIIPLIDVDGELTTINDPLFSVGIIPDDRRPFDWFKPDALYRLHEQTVHLYFVPESMAFALETAENAPRLAAPPSWEIDPQ
jgi:hypothetical protein